MQSSPEFRLCIDETGAQGPFGHRQRGGFRLYRDTAEASEFFYPGASLTDKTGGISDK